jgi:hypothetical protein
MKEHPILFSTPMVQAILEGRKTMTRRICKHQHWSFSELTDVNSNGITQKKDRSVSCQYGSVVDMLWVKETFYAFGHWTKITDTETGKEEWHFNDLTLDQGFSYLFEDCKPDNIYKKRGYLGWYKRPSIFMPKIAARIWLKITNEKVERLYDISSPDAIHEGVQNLSLAAWKDYLNDVKYTSNPRCSFFSLWISINGAKSYESNPWLWVVQFEVISTTGKPAEL